MIEVALIVAAYLIWWVLTRALLYVMEDERWWEEHNEGPPPEMMVLLPFAGEFALAVALIISIRHAFSFINPPRYIASVIKENRQNK